MKLTVVVLSKNENSNITDCLKSVQNADELLLIDDFSDDDTTVKAEALGAVVYKRALDSFAEQRNFALEKATGDWIFFLDADERFSPELMESVRKHMDCEKLASGSVIRRNRAFGREHRFGPLKPDAVTRLFPRGMVHWVGAIHERPVCQLESIKLKGHLTHLTYKNFDHYLKKQYRYATQWAFEAAQKGKTATAASAWLRSVTAYSKMMILNLGLLGGPLCWSLCFYHAAYTLTKYLKLYEHNRQKTLSNE